VATILPFVFLSAIPISAVVIWLVMRSLLRDEQAARQLITTST
jgi:hypothetical protein